MHFADALQTLAVFLLGISGHVQKGTTHKYFGMNLRFSYKTAC